MENKCVCCGVDVPEGRQVCPQCENKEEDKECWSKQLETNLMKQEKTKTN